MADTGKPYNLIIPTEYNNDWYSAFVSLIQSIATVVGISEAQMSNCHDYKFLIQDINERLKSHIDSQDTVLDLKTALTKLDLGYGLNQLNVMWDALQAYNWNKRYLSDFDNVKGADIPALFSALNMQFKLANNPSYTNLLTQANATDLYTIGPTGSGANVEWSQLDNVPSTSKHIIVSFCIKTVHSSDAAANCYSDARILFNSADNYFLGRLIAQADLANEVTFSGSQVDILLDSNKIFKVTWDRTTTVNSTHLLSGLITGYYD